MTGKTISLGRRGMAMRPFTILVGRMTLCTELGRFSKQPLVCRLPMAGMAIETSAFFIGLMLTTHLGPIGIGMALQTETVRTHSQQISIFTGMAIMAGAALSVHNRLMNTICLGKDGLMTGGTKGIRFLRGQEPPPLTASMARDAVTLNYGAMNLSLEQARPC